MDCQVGIRSAGDSGKASASGLAAPTVLLLLIFLAGGYSFGPRALHGAALVRAAALWALASLAIGLQGELFFRGYARFTLAKRMGFWPAAFLLSFGFGAAHFFLRPNERWTDWVLHWPSVGFSSV